MTESIAVTIRNHTIHATSLTIVCRFPDGAEVPVTVLPPGEFHTSTVQDGCELVIRPAGR